MKPAFPIAGDIGKSSEEDFWHGMTLRDYFAALAMNARMQLGNFDEIIATQAYEMADAMLKARDK